METQASAAAMRFDLGGGDALLLPGVTEAELAARDFVFR